MLRVWLYLIDNKREIIRSSEIAHALGVSVDMISAAKKVLTNDLHAIVCNRVNKINSDGSFIVWDITSASFPRFLLTIVPQSKDKDTAFRIKIPREFLPPR